MAMNRFCHFLANEYHLQKLSNISSKHLEAYVLWMQEKTFGTGFLCLLITPKEPCFWFQTAV